MSMPETINVKTITYKILSEKLVTVIGVYLRPLYNPTPMVMRGALYFQEVGHWRRYSSICVDFTFKDGAITQLVSVYDMGDEFD